MQVELIFLPVLKYHKLKTWQVGGATPHVLWEGQVTAIRVTDK